MPLSPQCQTVLNHLQRAGSITGVEAAQVHKVRHLPRRIADLKKSGVSIATEMRKDVTGQRYAHYTLAKEVAA